MRCRVSCGEAMRTSGEPAAKLGWGGGVSSLACLGSPEPRINTADGYPELDLPAVWRIIMLGVERETKWGREERMESGESEGGEATTAR